MRTTLQANLDAIVDSEIARFPSFVRWERSYNGAPVAIGYATSMHNDADHVVAEIRVRANGSLSVSDLEDLRSTYGSEA